MITRINEIQWKINAVQNIAQNQIIDFNITIFFNSLDVCPLLRNILKETYDFQTQCAQKCLQDVFCAGFNFRTLKGQPKKANCQLTHNLDHEFHVCSKDDKGWIFYHSVKPWKVKQYGISKKHVYII
jgi:hypothetical protein